MCLICNDWRQTLLSIPLSLFVSVSLSFCLPPSFPPLSLSLPPTQRYRGASSSKLSNVIECSSTARLPRALQPFNSIPAASAIRLPFSKQVHRAVFPSQEQLIRFASLSRPGELPQRRNAVGVLVRGVIPHEAHNTLASSQHTSSPPWPPVLAHKNGPSHSKKSTSTRVNTCVGSPARISAAKTQ